MAKAKKSAVKKGKYMSHSSRDTCQPGTKADGPDSQDTWLPRCDFGMLGWQLSLPGQQPEVEEPWHHSCWKKKSGLSISSSITARTFEKFLDVDDLTFQFLSLQLQSRKHQRRSPRRPPQRKLPQRRSWRRPLLRRPPRSPRRLRSDHFLPDWLIYKSLSDN